MLVSFARQTLQVIRAPLVTDHGNQARDWTNAADPADVLNCLVDTGAGATDFERRTGVRTDLTVLMPPGTDVLASDHIRVPGYVRDFTIVDGPRMQTSPSNLVAHTQLGLQVWEG